MKKDPRELGLMQTDLASWLETVQERMLKLVLGLKNQEDPLQQQEQEQEPGQVQVQALV